LPDNEFGPLCGNQTIRADEVSDLVEKVVLAMLADSERMVKVWEAGPDSADELAELTNSSLI
jgi:site-specific DNA recombinase